MMAKFHAPFDDFPSAPVVVAKNEGLARDNYSKQRPDIAKLFTNPLSVITGKQEFSIQTTLSLSRIGMIPGLNPDRKYPGNPVKLEPE